MSSRISLKRKMEVSDIEQEYQPNNELGGFANPRFVLINGSFWKSSERRRYIQGQLWLSEFTEILLKCCLLKERTSKLLVRAWNQETLKHYNELGALEILKYAWGNSTTLVSHSKCTDFEDGTQKLIAGRNLMTHEVGKWTNNSDMLRELLTNMCAASKCLVNTVFIVPRFHDKYNFPKEVKVFIPNVDEFHDAVKDFSDKCKEELGQMKNHPQLY